MLLYRSNFTFTIRVFTLNRSENVFCRRKLVSKPQDIPEQQFAGGVVVRKEDGRVLVALVQERGHGDFVLPKGRMEPGETIEQTAIREVEEEAGFEKLTLHSLLGAEERLAFDRKTWKTTHFFSVSDR